MASGTIPMITSITNGGTGGTNRSTGLNNLLFADLSNWTANGDADNQRVTGIIQCSTGWSNVPIAWGFLIIFSSPLGTVQFYEYGSRLWVREYRAGSWNPWSEK